MPYFLLSSAQIPGGDDHCFGCDVYGYEVWFVVYMDVRASHDAWGQKYKEFLECLWMFFGYVPFPEAVRIPTGPLKLSTQPLTGSFMLETTGKRKIFRAQNLEIVRNKNLEKCHKVSLWGLECFEYFSDFFSSE